MVDGKMLVQTARRWIGVRWQHQGRSRHGGVDCVGLCLCVAHELNIHFQDVTGYARRQDGRELMAHLDQGLRSIAVNDRAVGDIGLFRDGAFPVHVGFLAELDGAETVIHAHARRRQVIEEPLRPFGFPFAVYRMKERD